MQCHHHSWTAHTVKQCQDTACLRIASKVHKVQHVERGMPSCPLNMTHGRTTSSVKYHPQYRMTSGMKCHHHSWTSYTDGQCGGWHDIINFGKNTRSDNIGYGMPSWTLESTHGWTMSSVECQHRPWPAHTNSLCQA